MRKVAHLQSCGCLHLSECWAWVGTLGTLVSVTALIELLSHIPRSTSTSPSPPNHDIKGSEKLTNPSHSQPKYHCLRWLWIYSEWGFTFLIGLGLLWLLWVWMMRGKCWVGRHICQTLLLIYVGLSNQAGISRAKLSLSYTYSTAYRYFFLLQ